MTTTIYKPKQIDLSKLQPGYCPMCAGNNMEFVYANLETETIQCADCAGLVDVPLE